ncbi:MAG: hypothetical protein WB992_03190 [Bryobacteraceae bacterium]
MSTSFGDQSQAAVIQVAAPGSNGMKRSIPCTFQGAHGKRLILQAGEPLPISTVISVEHEDALALGEVLACAAGLNGAWSIDVKVHQVLSGLESLMALRAGLLGERLPGVPSQIPARLS